MPLQILPVDQGQLNRLLTSMVVPNFPTLNASVAYLGKGSISKAMTVQAHAAAIILRGSSQHRSKKVSDQVV